MASGTRQSNTMEEILRKQLSMYADLKLADDADFDWIATQEAQVIQKLRGPQDQMQTQGITGAAPSAPVPGMPPGMAPPMPEPGAMGGGTPVGVPSAAGGDPTLDMMLQAMAAKSGGGATPPGRGPGMSSPQPNPDELRRVLSQGQ